MALENGHELKQLAAVGGGVTLAFITGAVVGAAAGILFAPQSGRQSRDRLRQYFKKTGENFRHFAEEAGHAIENGRHALQGKENA